MTRRIAGAALFMCGLMLDGAASAATTSLPEATRKRDKAAVQAQLKQGGDVNATLADGSTALQWAVQWGDVEIVDALLKAGAKPDAANRFGATPLWLASTSGSAPIVERLLAAGANAKAVALGGEPVLMTAAKAGSVEAVRALLARGADPNAKEARRGQTALMWAVGGRDHHPAVVKLLLEHKVDVAVRAKGGLTALLFAVRQGDVESVRYLLHAGADVNDRAVAPDGMGVFGDNMWSDPSADGSSALIIAINSGHYAVARLLVERGADPNIQADPYPFPQRPNIGYSFGDALKPGLNALHALVVRRAATRDQESLDLIKLLLAKGAKVNAKTPALRAPDVTQLNPQPRITWVQVGGVTPFWLAANALDRETMELLKASGADPTLPNMEGTTPLMVAAGLGTRSRGPSSGYVRHEKVNVGVLQLLVDWGNAVNAVNQHGQTALHGAAFAAQPKAAQFLLDHGARLDLRDSLKRRPVEVAHDNLRLEYRPALQLHDPAEVDATIALLDKVTPAAADRAAR